jgi:hypothetical protein
MILAQSTPEAVSTSWDFDWPYTAGEWALALTFVVVAGVSVWLYRRDSRALPRGWGVALGALRLVVLAILGLILLNPHTRTQTSGHRPSQVAILVDTSTSMQQPAVDIGKGDVSKTRMDAVRAALVDSPLLAELRKTHVVDLYTFDSDLSPLAERLERTVPNAPAPTTPPKPIDWNKLLTAKGSTTRLADSVDKLLGEERSKTLAGVLLWTDGASNAGREVRAANDRAKAQGARIIAIGVGGTEPPVNLALGKLISPSDVQKGDAFELTAILQGLNLAGKTASVELLEKGPDDTAAKVIETREAPLGDSTAPVEVKFDRQAPQGGAYEYVVRAKIPGLTETRDDDNIQVRTVNAFDRPLKVLMIASGPMRDYVFSKTVLFRNRGIILDVWLQTGEVGISQEANQLLFKFPESKEELFSYDAILAFDTDWSQVSEEQQKLIEEWVSVEGGGILFVAGDSFTSEFATNEGAYKELRTLYPVVLDEVALKIRGRDRAEIAHPLQFTVEGKAADFLQLADTAEESAQAWSDFNGVFRCYPTRARKGGATVYIEFSDPLARGRDGAPVLLAGQRYGQGAAMYLGSPELWRLRSLDEKYYERLWTKLTRKVAEGRSKRGVQRALVILEGREFELGQTVPVRARVVNAQYEPLAANTLRIEVLDPRGRPLIPAPVLERDRNRPAEYFGGFHVSLPGRYRIQLNVPDSTDQATDDIDVTVPQREFASLQQDVPALKTLVDGTGGQYLPISDAAQIPSLLPDAGQEFIIDQRIKELWDRDWMLWLLVGLLSLEWLLRKILTLA